MAHLRFLTVAALLLHITIGQGTRCPKARYMITIDGQFSAETVPDAPPNPLFSPLTVFTHSTRYSSLVLFGYATDAIRDVAELGDNTQLLEDLSSEAARPFVKDVATTGPFAGDASVSAVIRVNCTMSVVTAVSMVAPSPDWIIAAANVNLFSDGRLAEMVEGDLNVYDAGTDSGATFTAPDLPTSPRENIAPLGAPFTMPAATYRIQRLRRGCPTVRYLLTVYNEWTTERFPDAPIGNTLSPLTAFSHVRRFSAFTLFGVASPGVQLIAEEGDNSVFLDELNSESSRRFIKDISTTDTGAPMGTSFSVELELNCTNSYVSFISMLAPSPDWIVADNSINVMSGGRFRGRISGLLFTYDAGTDSGETATAENMPTIPQENIAKLLGPPFDERYVARYELTRIRSSSR